MAACLYTEDDLRAKKIAETEKKQSFAKDWVSPLLHCIMAVGTGR